LVAKGRMAIGSPIVEGTPVLPALAWSRQPWQHQNQILIVDRLRKSNQKKPH
jgi:hypothetical protein